MFSYHTSIKLHHTDAAGVLFFAKQFQIVHDAYEAMLEKNNMLYRHFFDGDYALPIVHAETSYQQPLRVSDKITIHLTVEKIGNTSFTLKHTIKRFDTEDIVGEGKTVHVAVDFKKLVKIPLPEAIKNILSNI